MYSHTKRSIQHDRPQKSFIRPPDSAIDKPSHKQMKKALQGHPKRKQIDQTYIHQGKVLLSITYIYGK